MLTRPDFSPMSPVRVFQIGELRDFDLQLEGLVDLGGLFSGLICSCKNAVRSNIKSSSTALICKASLNACYNRARASTKGGGHIERREPDQLSKACGFPFKTVFAGSRQPCGLPLPHCVRSGGQSFRVDRYLFSHYGSHSSPAGPAGLYLLRSSGWWISPLFRLVGALLSANLYLRFC